MITLAVVSGALAGLSCLGARRAATAPGAHNAASALGAGAEILKAAACLLAAISLGSIAFLAMR